MIGTAVKCDGCGKVDVNPGANIAAGIRFDVLSGGWMRVSVGPSVADTHFCTYACLEQWAHDQGAF